MASTTSSAREALDFLPGTTGSLNQRFQKAGMTTFPRSLRALMDKVSPEVRTFAGELKVKDVKINTALTVASNGDFFWTVDGKDSGALFGDEFTVTVALTRPAADGTVFGLSRKEALDAKENGTWGMAGHSPWLVENWPLTGPPTGLHIHLKVSWDVEAVDVLKAIGIGLGAVVVGFGLILIGGGYCTWETNEKGERVCAKRW